jgi:hypothetical protein
VPWWAIAGGKPLAALLLTLATAFIGGAASLLAEWNLAGYARGLRDSAAGGGLVLFLVLVVGLVALGHSAGVVYRSRSAWAALDFLLFAATVLGAILLFRAFVRLGVVTASRPPEPWRFAGQLLLVALVPLRPRRSLPGAAATCVAGTGRCRSRSGPALMAWFAVIGGLARS